VAVEEPYRLTFALAAASRPPWDLNAPPFGELDVGDRLQKHEAYAVMTGITFGGL
jgi:hypothetical protein